MCDLTEVWDLHELVSWKLKVGWGFPWTRDGTERRNGRRSPMGTKLQLDGTKKY